MKFGYTIGKANLSDGYVASDRSAKPLGIEIALITNSIEIAHQQAIAAGAVEIAAPKTKSWGQVVSYVRCPDGTLVELCTPMS